MTKRPTLRHYKPSRYAKAYADVAEGGPLPEVDIEGRRYEIECLALCSWGGACRINGWDVAEFLQRVFEAIHRKNLRPQSRWDPRRGSFGKYIIAVTRSVALHWRRDERTQKRGGGTAHHISIQHHSTAEDYPTIQLTAEEHADPLELADALVSFRAFLRARGLLDAQAEAVLAGGYDPRRHQWLRDMARLWAAEQKERR